MKLPLQISFHNLERIEAVENRIMEEAAQLDEFCNRIMSCRVVVDMPHRHHFQGNVYQVRLDIKAPGEEIAIVQEGPTRSVLRERQCRDSGCLQFRGAKARRTCPPLKAGRQAS